MCANYHHQITQLLSNKKAERKQNNYHCCLQRNKSLPAPSTTQQDTQQQTDNILENVNGELNEITDEAIDIKVSTEFREKILRDTKHHDKKSSKKQAQFWKKEKSRNLYHWIKHQD